MTWNDKITKDIQSGLLDIHMQDTASKTPNVLTYGIAYYWSDNLCVLSEFAGPLTSVPVDMRILEIYGGINEKKQFT